MTQENNLHCFLTMMKKTQFVIIYILLNSFQICLHFSFI